MNEIFNRENRELRPSRSSTTSLNARSSWSNLSKALSSSDTLAIHLNQDQLASFRTIMEAEFAKVTYCPRVEKQS